jgi:protein-disulfide isomerase
MKNALLLPLALLMLSTLAPAQDPALLRPPKGAPVAIIVFEDLQCPRCRQEAPIVANAGKTYKIPVIRHDFPLPMHNWSFNAAVIARYFDTHTKELGNQFRDYIFQHQSEINPDNLQAFAARFAADHKVDLPFVVDPQGKFAALVREDKDLGVRVGIQHTPTIYVVSGKPGAKPFVEVQNPDTELYTLIEATKNE